MDDDFMGRWESACRQQALKEWSKLEDKVGDVGEAFFSNAPEVTMATEGIGWLRDAASDTYMAGFVAAELERRGLTLTDEELGRVASAMSLTSGPMFGHPLDSLLDRALYDVTRRRDLEALDRDKARDSGERHEATDLAGGQRTVENPNGGEPYVIGSHVARHGDDSLEEALTVPKDDGGSISWYVGDDSVAMFEAAADGSPRLVTDMESLAGPAYEDAISEAATGEVTPTYMGDSTRREVEGLRGRDLDTAGEGHEVHEFQARVESIGAPSYGPKIRGARTRIGQALSDLESRADSTSGRGTPEAISQVTKALMGNGTVYDARAGLLFESHAKEPDPTVALFQLEPGKLASMGFSEGERSADVQPGRYLWSYDMGAAGDKTNLASLPRKLLVPLARGLAADLEAGDATVGSGDMAALTKFASTWEQARATERADEASWKFSDPALGGLASGFSPKREGGDADRFAVLDTLRRGSSYYSERLGVLVTPMPSDKAEGGWACAVTREVAPDVLASAVSDYDRHLSRVEGDEYGISPRSLAAASPHVEAHGQTVFVEGDSPDMDSLVALVSKAGAGFEADGRGGDAYGHLLARGRVLELVEEGPLRPRPADWTWARSVLEGPEDLWSPERETLAVSYMDPMNSQRDVEVYEGVTEDVMRTALAEAGPGAKLSDAAEGLECTYVVSAEDEASMRGLCWVLASDDSFMRGDDAIRGMEATDALRLWLDRENVARDPVGVTSAEDMRRGLLAVERCEDMASTSIGVFARSTADATGSVATEVCVGLKERDWAEVASYEASLGAGDPTMPEGLERRLEGAMRIPAALPSGSALVAALVGNPAFGFSPASQIGPAREAGAGSPAVDRDIVPSRHVPDGPRVSRGRGPESPRLDEVPGVGGAGDTSPKPLPQRAAGKAATRDEGR